jgi:hypothetical protein
MVSLDEDAPSAPPSEPVTRSTLTPEDLGVLATAFEPEHPGYSTQRIYRGSFLHERPLECQILVKEADEPERQFQRRIASKKNNLRTKLVKRAFLKPELDDKEQEWNMDELLIFLNGLEDCWRCSRGCRADEGGSGTYNCTFKAEKHLVHDSSAARPLIHIRYPLEPLEDRSRPRKGSVSGPRLCTDDSPPANGIEVSVSVAWVAAAQVGTSGEAGEESVESGFRPVWSAVEDLEG